LTSWTMINTMLADSNSNNYHVGWLKLWLYLLLSPNGFHPFGVYWIFSQWLLTVLLGPHGTYPDVYRIPNWASC
jgi:hypothetical protein